MLLKGGVILNNDFHSEQKDIYVNDGKIYFDGDAEEILDISGLTVIPGLIDLHIHGFMGNNITCANYEELNCISMELLKSGITSFLATTSTLPKDDLKKALKTISYSINSGTDGAEILGIYMEGPFISKKFKGGMLEEAIRLFNEQELEEYIKASDNNIKMMTIAPEIAENLKGIEPLRKRGIIPSIGHSNSTANETEYAISLGVLNATHLFNAMRGLNHREPGVVGGVFDSNITAELICDGHHINERTIRLAYKLLGKERLILISDAIPFAGMPDGEYSFDGQTSHIKDGTCKLLDGTLNGNVNSLFECVKRAVKFGIPFCDAVYSASYTPAKRLGVDNKKGSIDVGKDADLIVMDNAFEIKYVIKNGVIKYRG